MSLDAPKLDDRADPRRTPGCARAASQRRGLVAAQPPHAGRHPRPSAARGRDRRLRGGRPGASGARRLLSLDRHADRRRAGEIAYVENATRGWDLAFYSLDFKPGDRILTCVSEYSSNYISYLQVAKKTGAEIVVVPDDKHGQIDLAALERAIDKRTKLVSISHIPTQGGLVQPAEAVGKIVNDAGILYLLDACQSVGMMPIDVKKIGCDFLSATGRKYMRGPRGTGFLYARTRSTSRIEPIFLDNPAARWSGDNEYTVMGDAKRFENWERYFAGVIGLKVAADQANELGMPAIWARLRHLADGLRERLKSVPGVTLADLGVTKGAIVTFAVAGKEHGTLKQQLRSQGINVSVSTQFSSRLDLKGRGLKDVMRASVHIYNTDEEQGRFVAALRPLAAG